MKEQNIMVVFYITEALRLLLARPDQLLMDPVINLGFVPKLVALLDSNHLQIQAKQFLLIYIEGSLLVLK